MIGLVSLIIREFRARDPVVDLRALANRTFAAGVFLIGMLGFVLCASLVLLPIYLQTLLGYPAYNAGLALSPRGLGSLATTPLAGYLTSKTNPRRLLVFGIVLGTLTMFDLSRLNLNAGYWDILWPQVFQGVSLSFLFIPLMAISMGSISKEKMGNATSIFNLMRNIGGSFGIAIMTTFLARRTQIHQNHLVEKMQPSNPQAREMLYGLQGWFHNHGTDSYTASRRALGAMYLMVQRQASMLSFVEAFWVMAVLFFAMMPFLLLLRNPHSLPSAPVPAVKKEEPEQPDVQQEEEAEEEELMLV